MYIFLNHINKWHMKYLLVRRSNKKLATLLPYKAISIKLTNCLFLFNHWRYIVNWKFSIYIYYPTFGSSCHIQICHGGSTHSSEERQESKGDLTISCLQKKDNMTAKGAYNFQYKMLFWWGFISLKGDRKLYWTY